MYNKIDKDPNVADEWRQLGFYYESDEESKNENLLWQKSATNLAVILNDYCSHENNSGLSEHTHLGPYRSYLKIMTWDKPLFKIDVIAGTIKDLYFLSKLILDKPNNTKPGNILDWWRVF